MAKTNKGKKSNTGWLDAIKEDTVEEPVEEAVVEVVEEVVEEPKPEPKKTNQNGSKAIVTSHRAWVFTEADVFSKPAGGVVRGNQLLIQDGPITVGKRLFYFVEVRKPDNASFKGYVESTKIKVV